MKQIKIKMAMAEINANKIKLSPQIMHTFAKNFSNPWWTEVSTTKDKSKFVTNMICRHFYTPFWS